MRAPEKLDRIVDFMWPFTITVGVLMTVGVIVFVAGAFILVYGAFLWGLPQWLEHIFLPK
jgi:hypothetical protein